MVLEHVSGEGQSLLIGHEGFADVSERILPFAGGDVLLKHAVTSEHAEEPLEVLGVAAGGEDAAEDLGGGDGSVDAFVPDGIGDVEANDGV